MLEVIGFIAVTLVFGYFFFAAVMLALMAFGGFDEVSIPGGIVFSLIAAGIGFTWWLWIGQHISVHVTV